MVKEEITTEIRKYLAINENENTTVTGDEGNGECWSKGTNFKL